MRKDENDLWIYLLLSSALLIFIESVKTYHFGINGVLISFSIPVLPFTYLLTNYIIKKYNYKKEILNIVISTLSVIIFVILMSFAMNKQIEFSLYRGELLAYIISQIFNICIFKYIINNTNKSYPIVYLTYIFILIIFYLIYTLSYLNTNILDGYWKRYFLGLIIQVIVCIPITIIHKKTTKGGSV